METTPKSLRLQIALFGRTNVGKSSVLNLIAGQDVAITSPIPGTTTDVVEKAIELLPLGPVTLLDTAGLDDESDLSEERIGRALRMMDRAEVIILVAEPNQWTDYEENIISQATSRKIPVVIVINKTDIESPSPEFIDSLMKKAKYIVTMSSIFTDNRDEYVTDLKNAIIGATPDYINSLPLLSDLIPKGGLVVQIIPVDSEAPKGRIILPQVQAMRDVLDSNAVSLVTQHTEYPQALAMLNRKPDLVICDSQVVHQMMADTPADINTTTYSIIFSRFKGDLDEEVRGAAAIKTLKPGDKILIAEACSHHANEDDIGRVKIPNWLRKFVGGEVQIDFVRGRDFPANLWDYKVVIHCGSCMLTRNEKLVRIEKCRKAGVPITNYGITISLVQGVLERALSPFPSALKAFNEFRRND
jgi:[FeFe] hydrogenase H-cluster maturation GTPase HydF